MVSADTHKLYTSCTRRKPLDRYRGPAPAAPAAVQLAAWFNEPWVPGWGLGQERRPTSSEPSFVRGARHAPTLVALARQS